MLQSFMTQYICSSPTNFVRNDDEEWKKKYEKDYSS